MMNVDDMSLSTRFAPTSHLSRTPELTVILIPGFQWLIISGISGAMVSQVLTVGLRFRADIKQLSTACPTHSLLVSSPVNT